MTRVFLLVAAFFLLTVAAGAGADRQACSGFAGATPIEAAPVSVSTQSDERAAGPAPAEIEIRRFELPRRPVRLSPPRATVQGGPPGAPQSSAKFDTYRRASVSPLAPTLRTGEAGSFASTPTYESHHAHPPERLPPRPKLPLPAVEPARLDFAGATLSAREAARSQVEQLFRKASTMR